MALSKEDLTAIAETIKSSIKDEVKEFYVDRETHYKHHEFVGGLIEALNNIKNSATRTITTVIVLGLLGLIALGFWMKTRGN